MPRVDVCVCTHQPRRDVWAVAMRALARQSLGRDAFRVLVIDNASEPALGARDTAILDDAGITCRVIREDRLSTAYARARAIRESTAPILVFVDDDIELGDTYLERMLAILDADPTLGCIGGRMNRAPDATIPAWFEPLRHFVGVRDDLGDLPISDLAVPRGSPAIPPSAGMAVRREIAELYLELESAFAGIGRRGTQDFGSCEDLLLARQAHRLGLRCGYRPEVELVHHIDPARFRFGYLLRFFYGQGYSERRVDDVLGESASTAASSNWSHRLRKLRALRDPRAVACLCARGAGAIVSGLTR